MPPYDGSVVAGHYFSKDGFTWRAASIAPYGNVIDLEDGSQQLLTTRERPKMIFNAAGDPTHLSNGVCPSPGNFNTPVSCPDVSTGCVDCVSTHTREPHNHYQPSMSAVSRPFTPPPLFAPLPPQKYNDWDFTNVSPLAI